MKTMMDDLARKKAEFERAFAGKEMALQREFQQEAAKAAPQYAAPAPVGQPVQYAPQQYAVAAPAQYAVAAPQYAAPQYAAPQYVAAAPQYAAPRYAVAAPVAA